MSEIAVQIYNISDDEEEDDDDDVSDQDDVSNVQATHRRDSESEDNGDSVGDGLKGDDDDLMSMDMVGRGAVVSDAAQQAQQHHLPAVLQPSVDALRLLNDSKSAMKRASERIETMRSLAEELAKQADLEETRLREEKAVADQLQRCSSTAVDSNVVGRRSGASAGSAITFQEASGGASSRSRTGTGALYARTHELEQQLHDAERRNRALENELSTVRRKFAELDAMNRIMIDRLRVAPDATPGSVSTTPSPNKLLKRTSRTSFIAPQNESVSSNSSYRSPPHAQEVSVDMMHACQTCGNKYASADLLQRHLQLRHGDNSGPFQCPVCENGYESKDLLVRHQMIRGHTVASENTPLLSRRNRAGTDMSPYQVRHDVDDQVSPGVDEDDDQQGSPNVVQLSDERRTELMALFASNSSQLVQCQAFWRGRLARKLVKSLRRRNDIVEELLVTEQSYVDGLRTVVKEYLEPISARVGTASEIASRATVSAIFSNWPKITNCHERLLTKLKGQLLLLAKGRDTTSPGSGGSGIGAPVGSRSLYKPGAWRYELAVVFSNEQLQSMRCYTVFVNNFLVARSVLEEQRKTNPRFAAFISRPTRNLLDINDLLITPVQRIPRYRMLLQDLLKNTPASHPDCTGLKRALEGVAHLAQLMNEAKGRYEEMATTMAKITGGVPPGLQLVVPHRVVCKQSPLLDDKGKPRIGVLCNDLLLELKDFDSASVAGEDVATDPDATSGSQPSPPPPNTAAHAASSLLSPRLQRLHNAISGGGSGDAVSSSPGDHGNTGLNFFKRTAQSSGLKIKRSVRLVRGTVVASLPDLSVGKGCRNIFQVTPPAASTGLITGPGSNKSYAVFCARTPLEKKEWIDAIRSVIPK